MIDCQPRTKNGHAPQSTTGVARISSIHAILAPPSSAWSGILGSRSDMLIRKTMLAGPTDTQNRRCMAMSSVFGFSSASTVRGSSAIPHIGQAPGASRTICACMGQTYSVFVDRATAAGSSAIPHFGQLPGSLARTSGCIGHTNAGLVALMLVAFGLSNLCDRVRTTAWRHFGADERDDVRELLEKVVRALDDSAVRVALPRVQDERV
jgi:hypothetical protein